MAEVSETEQLIFDIAQFEWELFQRVNNTGGRASCQDNPNTFFKMRMSQWMIYPREILESYWKDLNDAWNEGRNLIFEKYGFMMETTYTDEYEKILPHLPKVSEEAAAIIDELAALHIKWDREVMEQYPHIRSNGRVLRSSEDGVLTGSSSESYLKGEYRTYSQKTLKLIWKFAKEADEKGENLLKNIVENETRFYGYASLEEAEEKHKNL